jgi:hypothetical protein
MTQDKLNFIYLMVRNSGQRFKFNKLCRELKMSQRQLKFWLGLQEKQPNWDKWERPTAWGEPI